MVGRRGMVGPRAGGRYSVMAVTVSSVACFVLGYLMRGFHQLTPPSTGVATLADATPKPNAGASVDHVAATESELSQVDDALKRLLADIAIDKEVLAAVSNKNLISPDGQFGMLKLWIDGVRQANVSNALVIALDDETVEIMNLLKFPCWRAHPAPVADKAKNGHAVSALKFQLLRDIMVLGYSVLLSDADILVLKNPFDFLYRDRDVEGMSDGYDPPTAYGYDDVTRDRNMGWAQYAHTIRIFTLNSGLFYVRPNRKNIMLMDRITARLMKAMEWDQAVFNEEIFFPTHDDYQGTHCTVRVMSIYDFVNTKTLFRTMRVEEKYKNHVPVTVHANYHPDKLERLQAVWKRFVEGDVHAIEHQTVGSCENDKCPVEDD